MGLSSVRATPDGLELCGQQGLAGGRGPSRWDESSTACAVGIAGATLGRGGRLTDSQPAGTAERSSCRTSHHRATSHGCPSGLRLGPVRRLPQSSDPLECSPGDEGHRRQDQRVGARRRVELKPIGSMVETLTVWQEGRRIDTKNQPSASVPFKHATSSLTLESDGDATMATFRLPLCI